MREAKKNGKKCMFNLTTEEKYLLEQLANVKCISQSEMLGFIIRTYALNENPLSQLEVLKD